MNDQVFEILSTSAKTGEVIRIIYNGGSQPGTIREIIPVAVTIREMTARDVATGIIKTFILSKVQIPVSNMDLPHYDPNAAPFPKDEIHRTIKEVLSNKVSEIEAMGWHVELNDEAASVHHYFKNGKPRKTPIVSLVYHEFTVDTVYNVETDDFVGEERKSIRPYRVDSINFAAGRTFGHLAKAIELFLDEIKNCVPSNAP